jgi:hypothetical protein
MHLHWWKSVECFHNGLVGYLQCFLDRLTLYKLGCHTAGCHCCTAAESFKFCLLDDAIVINIQVHTHDVSALCSANTTWVLNLSYVSWVIKMVHYLFAVHFVSLLLQNILSVFPHKILIQRRHAAQTFDNCLQFVYCIINLFHGCLLGKCQTKTSVCNLMRQSNCQKHMGRV